MVEVKKKLSKVKDSFVDLRDSVVIGPRFPKMGLAMSPSKKVRSRKVYTQAWAPRVLGKRLERIPEETLNFPNPSACSMARKMTRKWSDPSACIMPCALPK